MKIKATISGTSKAKAELNALIAKSIKSDTEDVIVGFSQNYAIYVHENMEATHEVGGAKYLEKAYKRLAGEIPRLVGGIYKVTRSITKGLLVAGLRVQRDAQKLVPVDTGALKSSAYTAKASKAADAARKAAGRA